MKRRLSSILVLVFKFVFPLLALITILASTLHWILQNSAKDSVGGLIFIFIWGGIFYFLTFRWKIVHLYGNTLLVSGFFHRIVIPINQISDVKASSWWGSAPRTITIELKTQTKFGNEIVFVPRGMGYTASTTAENLKQLFNLTK